MILSTLCHRRLSYFQETEDDNCRTCFQFPSPCPRLDGDGGGKEINVKFFASETFTFVAVMRSFERHLDIRCWKE